MSFSFHYAYSQHDSSPCYLDYLAEVVFFGFVNSKSNFFSCHTVIFGRRGELHKVSVIRLRLKVMTKEISPHVQKKSQNPALSLLSDCKMRMSRKRGGDFSPQTEGTLQKTYSCVASERSHSGMSGRGHLFHPLTSFSGIFWR